MLSRFNRHSCNLTTKTDLDWLIATHFQSKNRRMIINCFLVQFTWQWTQKQKYSRNDSVTITFYRIVVAHFFLYSSFRYVCFKKKWLVNKQTKEKTKLECAYAILIETKMDRWIILAYLVICKLTTLSLFIFLV